MTRFTLVGMAALLLALLAPQTYCDTVSFDFEAGLPAGVTQKGDVQVVADVVHSGARALRVGKGGEVLIPVSPTDGFGTVTLWVYDSGFKLEGEAARGRAYGPVWGIANSASQQLVFGLLYAPYLAGNDSYGWVSTADGSGWASRRYARAPRRPGWHEWKFVVSNETDIVVSVDGRVASAFDIMASKFFRGFSGIYLRGPVELEEPVLVDDISVTYQPAVLSERTRPLPGEKRKPPQVTPVPLKPELVGKHPRLFFTAEDLPAIRERCKTTHKDFFDRLMGSANSYVQQMPPANAAQCSNDQDMQQWGWWRLTSLAFGYIATGDEAYAKKAIEWMDVLTSYPDWGTGEEINQSMGAANMLTGIACAYDWCYGLMTEEQRQKVRDKLLRQVAELYWTGFMDGTTAGYWKGDEQNNHVHHRLSGLTLGALAIDGEVPEAEGYVAAALGFARKVSDAIPPDGASHEGPHYSAFGYNYVVLLFEALRHCTDVDLFSSTPGLRNVPFFRAHLLTPGFHDTFNFGDCGTGVYYFNHYLFRLASYYKDPAAQALMKAAYDAEPGSFSYYPWCILWYDADLKPTPLDQIPTSRYFEDLELATYRTSWTDPNSLAVLLKCGPYGGHRLNELVRGWVNIAHDHPDANHFMLFWKGQMWATDDGYPKQNKAGANHNLILVDGQGPTQRGGGWLQPIANQAKMGKIDKVVQREGLFAVRGDASAYYSKMKTMYRWLAVVQDKYVILCDRLESASGPRRFEWLMHSGATCTQTGSGYDLTKGEQTLHLQFALPEGLSATLDKDVLEGKDRGTVLKAGAPAAQSANFVTVLSVDPCPPVKAVATADTITVTLGDKLSVVFQAADGDVILNR
ncbi:MAG: DUF4962 domain-containing protein [Armatimonadia bacterium]